MGAETWIRCRIYIHAYIGSIPRDRSLLSEGIRNGWGLRFIREWNEAPFIQARNTPCR